MLRSLQIAATAGIQMDGDISRRAVDLAIHIEIEFDLSILAILSSEYQRLLSESI